jgi:hypothetical protein
MNNELAHQNTRDGTKAPAALIAAEANGSKEHSSRAPDTIGFLYLAAMPDRLRLGRTLFRLSKGRAYCSGRFTS